MKMEGNIWNFNILWEALGFSTGVTYGLFVFKSFIDLKLNNMQQFVEV